MNVSDSDKRDPFEPRLQDPLEPRLTDVGREVKLFKQKEDEARINREFDKLVAEDVWDILNSNMHPFNLKVYRAER